MLNLTKRAKQLGEILNQKQLKLATVESLTAGMIASTVADIPGSSAWLERGWIVYCNQAKADLGVPWSILEQYGAVSAECAGALTHAAISKTNADIVISATGLAGPTGDKNYAAGTFFLGIETKSGLSKTAMYHVTGTRNAVRKQVVMAAFELIQAIALAMPSR